MLSFSVGSYDEDRKNDENGVCGMINEKVSVIYVLTYDILGKGNSYNGEN